MSDRKYRQRGYQDDDRDRPATPKPQRPAPEPGAPAGAQALVARPTVTHAATEFHLARPAEDAARIAVLDASGRLVRRLDVPRGATARTWDGRDAEGRPAAAGVYLARFTSGRWTGRTRIVIVR